MPPAVVDVDPREMMARMDRNNSTMESLIEAILHGETNRGVNQGRAFQLDNQLGSTRIKDDEPSIFFSQEFANVLNTGRLIYRPVDRQRLLRIYAWTGTNGTFSFFARADTPSGVQADSRLADPTRIWSCRRTTGEGWDFGKKGVILTPQRPLHAAGATTLAIAGVSLQLAPLGD